MPAMEENVLKRILPHSVEAEQSVIGSMIMDKEAIVVASELITGEDFYNRQYGILFETMVELHDSDSPVDLVTLQNKLKEKDVPPEVSSLEFVRDLITAVPTSANIKYYANIVAEKSTLRKLIRLNEEIANTCYAGKESLEFILEDTEKRVFQLVQKRTTDNFVPVRQIVMNAMDKIEIAAKNKGSVTGIPTGFIDLDYRTAGMQPSDLILVAARPSMGKTAFELNLAQYMAFKKDLTVALFSLEMSKEQLVNRMFSLESNVDAQKLRTGQLNDQEWERLIESAGTIGKSKLIIDDTPGISIAELRSKCRKYKLEYDLSIIMIDYLQLMSGSGRNESRQQEISDISRSLKALARELNVPVIALSQLSRAVEQRPDHRPMLSDLRESGAIEQDADVVMFLYIFFHCRHLSYPLLISLRYEHVCGSASSAAGIRLCLQYLNRKLPRDLRVKLYGNLIGAEVLQALRQLNFLFIYLYIVLFLTSGCDFLGRYRAESSASLSCLNLNHHLLVPQPCSHLLCRIQLLLSNFITVCLLQLQIIHIFRGSLHTNLLRMNKISGISFTDFYYITLFAKLFLIL